MKFLCVGAAVQDVFMSHSEAFAPVHENGKWFEHLELGGKFNVNKIDFATGGGASNAATTFARAGHESVFIGTIGRDIAGDAVMMTLDRENIDTRFVTYSREYNTGYSVLMLAPNGERTILTYRGASTHYDKKNFEISRCKNVDWLYATAMNGKMEIFRRLFLQAKAMGAKVAFNPGKNELSKRNELVKLLPLVDVLITNREEMSMIVPGNTSQKLIERAIKLVPVAIVTDGHKGALASDGRVLVKAGLYDNIRRTVDRTGAGDAFGSGLVLKLAEGRSLAEAVHFASANASEVCQAIGAKTNILHKSARIHNMPIEVLDF
ncbi:MAG: carbohydrate kinase family protein [Candidatus Nomurabacteria bacterium]|jgi:ribokinase|nr:carbohydrate kinase family protein [Candidatus Nomurabacteria bacterium]